MPSVFLVSDTHFGHKGVCHFTRNDGVTKLRPFDTPEEMDEFMVEAWNNKLQLTPRAHIVNLVKAFPSAIIIMHQVNNEYNYSFLEFITMGFPVVHNIKRFKEYGYYYDTNDFDGGADQIDRIIKYHSSNKVAYAAQVKQLTWNFSINNPANLEGWNDLLFKKAPAV